MTHRELFILNWFDGIYACLNACKGDLAASLAACLANDIFNTIQPMEKRCIFIVIQLEVMRMGATARQAFDHFMKKEQSNDIWTPN